MTQTLLQEGRALYGRLLEYTIDAALWTNIPPGQQRKLEPGMAYQRVSLVPQRPTRREVGSGVKIRTTSLFLVDLLVPIAGQQAKGTSLVVDSLEKLLERGQALCDHFWPEPRGPRSWDNDGVCCRMQKAPYLSSLQDEVDSEDGTPLPFKKVVLTVPYTVDD